MVASLSLLHGRLLIESEGADVKAIFRELGQLAEIFEADSACGACGSDSIRPNCRSVDGYEYFALHCTSCSAELSFGQRKDSNGLFRNAPTRTAGLSQTAAGGAGRRRPSRQAPALTKSVVSKIHRRIWSATQFLPMGY